MKKLALLTLCLAMAANMVACSQPAEPSTSGAETLTGVGKGFGGELKVAVTKDGDKITAVEVTEHSETNGISDPAIEQIPSKIVEANSTDVDIVAGATVTSEAIIYAVNNALDPATYPAPTEEVKEPKEATALTASDVYQGFGLANLVRKGPGTDDTDTQVWSTNQVFANVLFDGDGKILSIYVDQLEVATPNYDGDGMPHFTGFPGQSYNNDENHDGKVDGQLTATEESFTAEVNGWLTKRERGDAYVMGAGTWYQQMDKFQEIFVGKTVEEVEEWFNKYTSDLNGRPLKDGSDKPEDKAKYDALSDEEKSMLADVTSAATMSLNDSHGDIIAAIKNAFESRVPLDIKSAAAQGLGVVSNPRTGPGADDKDTPVWSINQIFANTLFDEEGRIISIYVDQLEIATPNYDGDGMPHFTGWPGQSYNNDENHDAKVDGQITATEESFIAEMEGWLTKRERGDAYRMGAGTWYQQMDKFQEIFVGKTVEEVEEWFAKYTSDLNGRPLKDGSDKPEDKAKYDSLTDDEKAMLADVTSAATMSLNDSHGDIIAAIKASFENRIEIDLTIK
ncbi:FMN-binding protein [Tissierella sp. Yu-01]|uniref:FMN-binding protein n=1 Tax=Tissierella sp. Yu-01 TaxID=3035694 RepID=UPI00240D6E23|nr:FMN-binding protein [Tissierella sp. Yu-01]WFA08858.1 FMN-binding protein [Tissierella sp. Yu-01]